MQTIEWQRLVSNKTVDDMSSSQDAVWIISGNRPFKYNDSSRRFDIKGKRKGSKIWAGLNGLALMTGEDGKAYEWAESD